MRENTFLRRDKNWKLGIIIVLLSGALALGTYLVRVGSTNSWPVTDCTVDGSRVVPVDVADSFRAIVMYKGEYHLRYVVDGREYYVWANSGWSDPDERFVRAKVESRVARCDFRVQYNPDRPSESTAVRK